MRRLFLRRVIILTIVYVGSIQAKQYDCFRNNDRDNEAERTIY
jgi:hypothetical protein